MMGEPGSGRGIGGHGAHWEPVGDKNGGGGGEVYVAPTAHLCPRREGGRDDNHRNGARVFLSVRHGSVADVSHT